MDGIFHCAGCGTALTCRISVGSLKDPSVEPPVLEDQQPVCEPGEGIKSYGPLVRSFGERTHPLDFAPQFWLHPDDVGETTEWTRDRGRLTGRCGIAGSDGPNIICRNCGSEVGTVQTDCYTPFIFVPEPKNTEFRKTGS